jgi:hypothetical protein
LDYFDNTLILKMKLFLESKKIEQMDLIHLW